MLETPLCALSWTQATANAAWTIRDCHTSVVFDNKMWVIGGLIGGNEVWYSTDGAVWTCATANAAWTARYLHTSVVTPDGRMWVIGGYNPGYRNDVWYSTNGVSWTRATANAAWSARFGQTSVVFNDGTGDKMWVIGGYDVTPASKNDVWYSTNGANWTQATANAAWEARSSHTSVVTSDGRMWVIGYTGYNNDVWYSTDGVNWTCATANAAWTARLYHTSVVTLEGRMWVLGGYANVVMTNDVWYSTDGVSWTFDSYAPWIARYYHTSVEFNNRIWVMGGIIGMLNFRNDVWCTNPIAVELIDFSAVGRDGYIELTWRTEAEIDNMKWLIIRCVGAYDNTPTEDYEQIACLPAQGSLSDYEYIDSLVVPGVYWYKLGDVDNGGNISWHGPISARVRGQPQGLPLRLGQPIPSPFRKETRIEYWVSGIYARGISASGGKAVPVSLKIYDISGEIVRTLVEGELSTLNSQLSTAVWDGKDNNGESVPSGIYFCSLSTGESKLTRKLIHIK